MTSASTRLPRVLFLHGYTQSGNTLRHKTGALRKALSKHVELVYPTAPISLEPPDSGDVSERARLDQLGNEASEGSFAWWRADEEKQEFTGIDKTMSLLKDVLEKQGPFDGAMGFSQGGGLVGMLAPLLEKQGNPLLDTTHPPLKFAVVFSGFRARFPKYNWIYEPPSTTPTLHVIGRNDPIVTPDRSRTLVDVNTQPQILEHPGSHFVPSGAPQRNAVVDFVVAHTRPRRPLTCIVAATSSTLGIGKNGGLPWRLRKEMAYFAQVTEAVASGRAEGESPRQNVVIMGRKSWESIPPKFRPLKNRINVVVSRDPNFTLDPSDPSIRQARCLTATSIDDALAKVEREYGADDLVGEVYIIGGGQLYSAALDHTDCHRLLLTAIDHDYDCDTTFPIDPRTHTDWHRQPYSQTITALTGLPADQIQEENQVEKDVKWEYQVYERRLPPSESAFAAAAGVKTTDEEDKLHGSIHDNSEHKL
ncbi:hypothetical protein PYCC9005_005724 [Savitreella phatthalungensis]